MGIAGLTPQVVTETIWALARAPAAWVPTHLHVLTTREGARRIELLLLPSEDRLGALAELAAELGLAVLPEPLLHVLHDDAGAPLDDITAAAHNLCAADQICELVQTLTGDGDSALHVSLAGGRKTMGFFAGAAMMLFGRPQDRLSHVLVNGALQAHPQFFFPPARRPRAPRCSPHARG
jgi:CRISPR-associated protein (TIGR02584 family)